MLLRIIGSYLHKVLEGPITEASSTNVAIAEPRSGILGSSSLG